MGEAGVGLLLLQVPGSEGALALYLLPRYLLRNALDVPIQYKQQGGRRISPCGTSVCTDELEK